MTRTIAYPQATGRNEDRARGTTWTDDEMEYLRIHYGRFPIKFVAENLRRSEQAIRIQACRMRKETQRVEAARQARNVSCLTMEAAE